MAREKAEGLTSEGGGAPAADASVYECPLSEQGAVILGGTKQAFGFPLRQQYFHKTVMLLLQHDDSFTKNVSFWSSAKIVRDHLWFDIH